MMDNVPAASGAAPLPKDLQWVARWARLLDQAWVIPGVRIPVGWDALLGLIPGVGDAVGAILGGAVVVVALRHRVPSRVVARMVVNLGVDLGLGTLPVLGDILDVLYRGNVRNVDLLLQHRDARQPPRALPGMLKGVLVGAAVGVTLLSSAGLWAAYEALALLVR